MESAEAFTSRFARTVDLLVNKVLRGLDRVELKPTGTLLDVVNGAEQRGFVASAATLREMKMVRDEVAHDIYAVATLALSSLEMKMVRNEVAHDYAGTRLPVVLAFCRERKPALDAICDRVCAYVRKLPG